MPPHACNPTHLCVRMCSRSAWHAVAAMQQAAHSMQTARASTAPAGVRCLAVSSGAASDAGADSGSSSGNSGSSSSESLLGSLVNYEQVGIPKAAGTAASGRFSLKRMGRLLRVLGDPQDSIKAVHVAGSKGKGSTVAMLSAILRCAGYRVGVYTSPHLRYLEERIALGSRRISPDDVAYLIASHRPALERCRDQEAGALSQFEVVTALAYRYFADCKVDVAVVETGLGGVTDATNMFKPSNLLVAIVTSLGLEHVEALGGSLESIAAAKAGIMKAGRPVVIAPQQYPETMAVLLRHAHQLRCPVVRAQQAVEVSSSGLRLDAADTSQAVREEVTLHWRQPRGESGGGSNNSSSGSSCGVGGQEGAGVAATAEEVKFEQAASSVISASMGFVGRHQQANIACALAAAGQLRQQGWSIGNDAAAEGLSSAALPGRFQVVKLPGAEGPYVVLDGAHTAESAAALTAAVRGAFPAPRAVALLVAMAADKPHREVLSALRGLTPKVVVFTSVPIAGSWQRAAAPGTLVAQWQAAAVLSRDRPFRCRELVQASLMSAFERARQELKAFERPGVIVVAGSLHAVAEAYKLSELEGLVG